MAIIQSAHTLIWAPASHLFTSSSESCEVLTPPRAVAMACCAQVANFSGGDSGSMVGRNLDNHKKVNDSRVGQQPLT